jgi:alpha-beta hydrolase superfamily lysophospholipase
MKTKTKRSLLALSLALLGGFVLLNAMAYPHAFAMMHFSGGDARTQEPEKLSLARKVRVLLCGVSIPRPQTTLWPLELGPGAQSLKLKCTNGVTLGAWYCPASGDSNLVLLFHGYTGEKSDLLPEAKPFLKMGPSVLLVDVRGSADSSESYTTIGFAEAEDVAAAVGYARNSLPHRQLILYGQSMGAAAVLRAVSTCGVAPDAIIGEAVFDTLLNTVRHRFAAMGVPAFPSAQLLLFWGGRQAGFNGFRHNPVEYAASVKCPILFLHGAEDARARTEEARRVFNAVPGRKRFEEFPGIRHEAVIKRYPEGWRTAIEQFLSEMAGRHRGPRHARSCC